MTRVTITDYPAKETGESISKIIREHVGDVVCLLPGRSSLEIIEYIDPSKHCFHQECIGTDEIKKDEIIRCKRSECRTIFIMGNEQVGGETELNNYLLCKQKYGDHAVTKNLIETVLAENESKKEFTERIEKLFLETLTELNNPKIISVLEIEVDGSIGGIVPLDKASFRRVYQDDRTYVLVAVEGLRIDPRASFTPNWILSQADILIGYAVGKDKQEILTKLNLETKELNERPAELINLHHNSYLYTDQDIEDKPI